MTIAAQLNNHLDRTGSGTIIAVDEGHWDAIAALEARAADFHVLRRVNGYDQ